MKQISKRKFSLGMIRCQLVFVYLKKRALGCGNSTKLLFQIPVSSLGWTSVWFGILSQKPFCNFGSCLDHVLHVQEQWGEKFICLSWSRIASEHTLQIQLQKISSICLKPGPPVAIFRELQILLFLLQLFMPLAWLHDWSRFNSRTLVFPS